MTKGKPVQKGQKTQNRGRWGIHLWLVPLVLGGVGGGRGLMAQPCTVSTDHVMWHQPQSGEGPAPLPSDPQRWKPPPQGKQLLPGTYVLRVQAVNSSPHPATCVFLPDTLAALAELFTPENPQPLARTGWLLPLDERALKSPQALLPAVLLPGTNIFWLRLWVPENAPKGPASLALKAQNLESLAISQRRYDHSNGIYGGIMLAVVLYNLFLFLSLREKLYLLYVLYASFFGLIWLVRAGMGLVFIWPHWPLWDAQAHYFMIGMAIVLGNAFTTTFLELPATAPRLAKGLKAVSFFVAFLLVGVTFQRFAWIEKPLALAATLACCLYVVAGFLRLKQKSFAARYFLLATGMVILGTTVYVAAFFQLLPTTFLTANSAQLGSAAEMVLLAFALGHKICHLRREKIAAEELSRRDPLTGLANRRALDEQMDLEWRRLYRQGSALAIVVVDVDHFKGYNDAWGHQAGDRLLQLLAEELRILCRRPGDLAARYGGEEFVLLLPGLSSAQAHQVAERLRAAVEKRHWPHPASPLGPAVTVSCGVAIGRPAEGVTISKLFSEADEALFQAKRSGRNQVWVRTASGTYRSLMGA